MKETWDILKFWLISSVVLVLYDLYFEYIISRSILPEIWTWVIAVPLIAIGVLYLKYLAKTIIKLLNLNNE